MVGMLPLLSRILTPMFLTAQQLSFSLPTPRVRLSCVYSTDATTYTVALLSVPRVGWRDLD